uniref:Uncharacterized protein n=1 Tax=Anguilla anguilla TaxID=7936 RepID=A0A0E9QIF0_ANGAN
MKLLSLVMNIFRVWASFSSLIPQVLISDCPVLSQTLTQTAL